MCLWTTLTPVPCSQCDVALWFDAQDICKRNETIWGMMSNSTGLQGLCRQFLKHDLNKDPRVRCGDWGIDDYSADQVGIGVAVVRNVRAIEL